MTAPVGSGLVSMVVLSRSKLLTKCQHLENHQAPSHDLPPAAFVLGLCNEVEPKALGIMLLCINDVGGDVFGDVVRNVISEDE